MKYDILELGLDFDDYKKSLLERYKRENSDINDLETAEFQQKDKVEEKRIAAGMLGTPPARRKTAGRWRKSGNSGKPTPVMSKVISGRNGRK